MEGNGLLMTSVPYTCRVCTDTIHVYGLVEETEDGYEVEVQRLYQDRCSNCDEDQRTFVLDEEELENEQ